MDSMREGGSMRMQHRSYLSWIGHSTGNGILPLIINYIESLLMVGGYSSLTILCQVNSLDTDMLKEDGSTALAMVKC